MIEITDNRVGKVINIVRHAQSAANIGDFYQASDAELTEEGIAQARLLGARLIDFNPEMLVSSPDTRAVQTTEHAVDVMSELTGEPYNYHVNDLFRERIKPSSINNKPYTDEVARATYERWEESLISDGIQVEDGENYALLTNRADQALDYLLERPESRITVISHGNIMRTIIGRVILKDLLTPQSLEMIQRTMLVDNIGITSIKYSARAWKESGPSWKLETLNDHAHLENV